MVCFFEIWIGSKKTNNLASQDKEEYWTGMPHIYVLELTEKTYFIGRCEDSEDLNEKLDNHFLGKEEMLDRFNKKIVLPVVRVDKIIRNITPKGETDCLLAYILLYGMLKVHTNLYCYRCGHVGHYKRNCLSRWHRNDFELEDS